MIMLFLAPFHAVILAVWGRDLWADWRHPLTSDHNVLRLTPILGVVEIGWSGGVPKNRKR